MNIDEIKTRLANLETSLLCDADKDLRVMDSEIRPVRTDLRLVGMAYTVTCLNDFLTVIQALQEAGAGDVLVAEEREFDTEEGRLYTDWTFSREGEIERRQSAMQLYTVRELDAMLVKAGMHTVASWGSWELDAFGVGAPILIQLAQKV